MRAKYKFTPALVSVAMIAALVAAGCGSSDSKSPTTGASGGATKPLKHVSVGLILSSGYAPAYMAIQKGYFKEEGLDVELKQLESSATIIPAVNSGQVDFGSGAVDEVMLAATNGVPLKIVAPTGAIPRPASPTSHDTTNAVIVGPKSPIHTAKDLEGKTVSVVQVKGLFELGVRTTAAREGADSKKIKFRTLPIPEGAQAAIDGKVDAAAVVEPFLTTALENGARIVMNIFLVDPKKYDGWYAGTYYTSDSYLKKNPETVAGFARALAKGYDYARTHIDEARKVIPTFTKLTPELANKVVLPNWLAKVDVAQLRDIAALMEKNGFLKKAPTPEDIIAPAAMP